MSLPKRPVIVKTLTFHDDNLSTGRAAYRSVPTIFNTTIHVPCVKTLKTCIQWNKTLQQNLSLLSFSCILVCLSSRTLLVYQKKMGIGESMREILCTIYES